MGIFQKGKEYLQQRFLDGSKHIELRKLLWVSFTLTSVVATLLMGISFYYRFAAQSAQTTWEGNDTRIEDAAEQVTAHFRNMIKVSDTLYYRVIKGTDLQQDTISDDFRLIYEMNKDNVESIALFSIDGNLICATPNSHLRPNFSLQKEAWYGSALDTEENIRFGAPQVSRVFRAEGDGYTRVIPMSRMVQLTMGDQTKRGVLLINLRYDVLQDMLENVMVGEESYVYLAGENGNLLYHPMQDQIAAGTIKEETLPLLMSSLEGDVQAKPYTFLHKTIGYTGWHMVGVSKGDTPSLHNWKTRSFILFLLAFFLNAMMLINFYVSRKVTEPMHRLEGAVKRIQAGDLNTKIQASGVYEIQNLSNAIEEMERNLKQLMEDIVQEHEAKRKSDLMVLQNQINPHFLYNTLDVIVWMIENEKSGDAVKAVTALARFFRISLSRGKTVIPVSDEVEHVRNYLMIQEMRFKNKFTYAFDVKEETKQLGTVKLILQPLVENAIYHAMEFMDDDGELTVKGYLEGEELILSVTDNGCGMTKERAEALLRGDFVQTGKGSGVGLRNVQERIQLVFGEKYGLRILSEPDEGTCIEIHLPAIPYEEMKERGMVS